jgi:hypothetical protein
MNVPEMRRQVKEAYWRACERRRRGGTLVQPPRSRTGVRVTLWGRLVRLYERHERKRPYGPDFFGDPTVPPALSFFWRLCWWLCMHGFISRVPENMSSFWRDYRWQWCFWRGPYWDCGYVARPSFRQSAGETWWLIRGGSKLAATDWAIVTERRAA